MLHPWRLLRDEHPEWVVVWTSLGDDLAVTDWEARTIYMDRRLSQAQRRSTIAHEMLHITRGPVLDDPVLVAREEAAVEQLAARALIGLRELGEALAWSQQPDEVAEVLWVDVPLLRVRLTHLHPSERHYLTRRLAALYPEPIPEETR